MFEGSRPGGFAERFDRIRAVPGASLLGVGEASVDSCGGQSKVGFGGEKRLLDFFEINMFDMFGL